MGECLQRTGTSVTLTSINNMVAFFMAALVPIPALRAFSLQVRPHRQGPNLGWVWSWGPASSSLVPLLSIPQAAIVVGCNFAAVMLVFPAILSLDLYRRHCQRLDVLCCFSRYCPCTPAPPHPTRLAATGPFLSCALTSISRHRPVTPSPFSASFSPCSARVIQILPQELADSTVPVSIAHLTATVQAFAHCEASSQHVVTILPPQACLVPPTSDALGSELFSPGGSTRDLLSQEEGTRQKAACKSLPCARWNLAHFVRHQFAPLLLRSQAKVRLQAQRCWGGAGQRLRCLWAPRRAGGLACHLLAVGCL